MKIPSVFLLLYFVGALVQAQPDSTDSIINNSYKRDYSLPGTMVVHADEKILRLMETISEADIPLEGFRIQLSFGRKEEVNKIRTEFLQKYPECRAYVSWLQPNFRLRIGDFRTRLQAERFKNEIQADYPSCYIVRDNIEPAPLD